VVYLSKNAQKGLKYLLKLTVITLEKPKPDFNVCNGHSRQKIISLFLFQCRGSNKKPEFCAESKFILKVSKKLIARNFNKQK
jgi:hypothetical protein